MNEKKKRKWLKSAISVLTIMTLVISIFNFCESMREKKRQEIQELLDLAEFYYASGNYEGLAAVYSDERLQENPQVLLNIGVMYAKGIYYLPDKEQAIRYWETALENGEDKYSFVYLLQFLGHEDMERIKQLVEIGCSKNNRYCERLLQDLYLEAEITCKGGYLYDFSQKTDNEKQQILSNLFDLAGYHTYEVATEYEYTADVTTIGEQEIYSNVKAHATKTEERKIELFTRRYFGWSDIQMVFE